MSQSAKATSCRWRWTRHCAARSLASAAMHFVHLQGNPWLRTPTRAPLPLVPHWRPPLVTVNGLHTHGVLLSESKAVSTPSREPVVENASTSHATSLTSPCAFVTATGLRAHGRSSRRNRCPSAVSPSMDQALCISKPCKCPLLRHGILLHEPTCRIVRVTVHALPLAQ